MCLRNSNDALYFPTEIENHLCIDINIDLNDLSRPLDWLDRLEYATSDIIHYIIEILHEAEGNVPSGKAMRYPVPCFEGEVVLILSNPLRPPSHASYYGMSHPVPRTQHEYRDFGDVICDKLGQMIPGMVNVLAVSTDSTSHDFQDLRMAIESLKELAWQRNDKFFIRKGLKGADDYIERVRLLSGVLLRSIWTPLCDEDERNLLCCNKDAECPIPKHIKGILRRMDY